MNGAFALSVSQYYSNLISCSYPDIAKICCPQTDILLPPKMESAFFCFWRSFGQNSMNLFNSSINDRSNFYLTNLFTAYFRPNSLNWDFKLLLLRGPKYLIGQCWISLNLFNFRENSIKYLILFSREKIWLMQGQIYWRSDEEGRGATLFKIQKYYVVFLNNPAPISLLQSLQTRCQNPITV